MAYINVAGSNDFTTLVISTATIATTATTGSIVVNGMQKVTLNNGNSVFRWKQLDATSEYAVATPATNQISLDIVIDPDDYYGRSAGTAGTADKRGLFDLSNTKALIYFRLYYSSTNFATGAKYVDGSGYFTGLQPTVSPDSPVWVTPLTIEVAGDFTTGTVA